MFICAITKVRKFQSVKNNFAKIFFSYWMNYFSFKNTDYLMSGLASNNIFFKFCSTYSTKHVLLNNYALFGLLSDFMIVQCSFWWKSLKNQKLNFDNKFNNERSYGSCYTWKVLWCLLNHSLTCQIFIMYRNTWELA
jgi:hypothetical protein